MGGGFSFGDGAGRSGSGMPTFADLFGAGGGGIGGAPMGGGRGGQLQETELSLTLEEVYHGKDVQMQLQGGPGGPQMINVPVRAGMRDQALWKYETHGVAVRLKTKPHKHFTRRKDDLVFVAPPLPLKEALAGCTIRVPHVKGKMVSFKFDGPLQPGTERICPGYGMPKKGGGFGDLYIETRHITLPVLSEAQKAELANIL